MTIEELVPTLETCRALKEAGMPQETYALWTPNSVLIDVDGNPQIEAWDVMAWPRALAKGHFRFIVAAPTAAEIGKWLPVRITMGGFKRGWLECWPNARRKWFVGYERILEGTRLIECKADTEAEARALMLLELVERGLVTFDKQEAGADA